MTTTKLVKSLKFFSTVIGDYTLPMPSDYKFELKKVYVEEPNRNNSGAMQFPDKFFVPYFTVTWNILSIDDYSTIMRLIQVDELVTEYYDTNEQVYKQAKFYVQQPTYNQLYTMRQEFRFVTNLQLIFAGTMNDIGKLTVKYELNGGSGTAETQTGLNGDEFIVNDGSKITRDGYTLKSWNTAYNGSGEKYALGSQAVMTYNLELYAQWEESSE